MNKKKFELQFDAKMELSDIKRQLGILSVSLNRLEIPANSAKNFEVALTKALNQLNSFETLSEKGIENLTDTKKLEKSWESVMGSLDGISTVLKSIDVSKVFPKEIKNNIKAAEKAVSEYMQKLEQAKQSPAYQAEEGKRAQFVSNEAQVQRDLTNAQNARMKAEATLAEKRGAWGEAAQQRYAAEEQNLKDINELYRLQEELIKRLESEKEQLQSEGYLNSKGEAYADSTLTKRGLTDTDKIKRASNIGKDLEIAKTEQTQYKTARKKAQESFNKAKKPKEDFEKAEEAVQELNKNVEEYTRLLQDAQNATATFEQTLENIAKGETAEFWKKLVEALSKIPGINLDEAANDLEDIDKALSDYETKELEKTSKIVDNLKQELKETEGPAKNVGDRLREAGETSEELERASDEITRLKQQVLDFFSITNAINIFKRAIADAFETVKELDAVMTEAAVVTDFSIGDMWDQMPQYSKNASELGIATKDLYAASTLYYQQGLKSNDVMKVGAETMKMAKIANMDATEATQAMTAALRGFNMEVNEMNAQKVNDVYSKLAAITAADTSQIATAMSKTASIAASANMEFETTAAFLAQIIETTQEAPETAGTALKTIIARFGEVKKLQNQGTMTGVDAEGEAIDINKISTALRSVGISMDDFFAGQEGLDSVLMRLSEKWDGLDFTTQHYIATMAAGSRQQSRFIAMMSNYGRTVELVGAANDSAGASQEQYEKTLESLDSKLAQLKNAWDQFTMGLANNEALKFGVEFLTGILETVNRLTDAISGGNGLVKSLASLMVIISAKKLGGKVLGKNSEGGLLGKVGEVIGKTKKGKSSPEFKRGFKDGQEYGEGWRSGVKKELGGENPVTDVLQETSDKTKELGDSAAITEASFKKLSIGMGVAASACGLLSMAFANAGMDDAAEATSILAASFTVLGTIVPVISKILVAKGIEVSLAWTWVTLIAVAIGVVIGLFYALDKAAEKQSLEYKLEQAQKATENAKKAAEEASAAYDELLNQKSSYSKTQEALEQLTRGTQEWKAALFEANQQTLKLLEKYPELQSKGYVSTDSNGRLVISDEGWSYMENKTLTAAQSTSTAYAGAKLIENELEYSKKQNESDGKSAWDKLDREDRLKKGIASNKRVIEEYKKADDWTTRYKDAIEEAEAIIEDYNQQLSELNLGPNEKKYRYGFEQAQQQQIVYTRQLINQTTEETQKSDYFGKVAAAVATGSASDSANKINKYLEEYKSKEEKDINMLYESIFGEAPEGMELEEKKQALASYDYGKELSKKVDNATQIIENQENETDRKIMAAAISGDTSGLSLGELKQLQGKTYTEIAEMFGYEYGELDRFAEDTGLTKIRMEENQIDYELMYNDLVGNFGKRFYHYTTDFFDSLSLDSVEKIGNFFQKGNIGSVQQYDITKAYAEAMADSDLEEDQAAILENLLTSTDWFDPLKSMDIMDTMLSMGIDQDVIVKYWRAATANAQVYVDTEQEALSLASRMQEKVKNMSELSNRLAEGTATKEDMELLQQFGIDTSGYKLTSEGWKATSEEIDNAISEMQKYYLTQAELQKQNLLNDGFGEDSQAVKNVEKIIEMLEQPITTTYNIETHIDLLDRIKEAVVFDRQKEIDKLSEINDTISDFNSRVVSAMRESIEETRRARENEKIEQNLADKQARLSYLKMDSSGANALEIKRLEKELAQEQESYTDRLIDEKLSDLERQNDIAQEQRAKQIELMQLQLEHEEKTGKLWDFVNTLFADAYNEETKTINWDSEAMKLLMQAEGVEAMSKEERDKWKTDVTDAFKESVKGMEVAVDGSVELDLDFNVNVNIGDDNNEQNPPTVFDGSGKRPLFIPLDPTVSKGTVQIPALATGGLVSHTGPAWLDGTKSKPEYVLSANQTKAFFTLVDVLGSLQTAPIQNAQKTGDSIYDIDINVESIGSDYDVEQISRKIEELIVSSSRYRNNNVL